MSGTGPKILPTAPHFDGIPPARPSQGHARPPDLTGKAFAGQRVGVKQVEETIWLVSFMRYDLGFFDHEACRIEPPQIPAEYLIRKRTPVHRSRVLCDLAATYGQVREGRRAAVQLSRSAVSVRRRSDYGGGGASSARARECRDDQAALLAGTHPGETASLSALPDRGQALARSPLVP